MRKSGVVSCLVLLLFFIPIPTGAFFPEPGFFTEPSLSLLAEDPKIGWDQEIMAVRFRFVKDLYCLRVSLREEGVELEQVSYVSLANGQIGRIEGFQKAFRLESADGMIFDFVYRKKNFKADKKNRVLFEGRFSWDTPPFQFCYQVVRGERDLIMELIDC